MRQRLGIAAALLGDPAVLMLDEPTNGLDPEGIIWVRELMRELAAQGRTVLVSSHLMTETALTVDHLVILGRGRLAHRPADAGIHRLPQHPRVRVRTTEPARLRTALAGHGLVLTDGWRPTRLWTVDGTRADAVGAIAAQEGIPILELADEQVSLEQAYLDLTGAETEFTSESAEPVREA